MTEQFIGLPPDAAGKKTATKEHLVGGETVQVSMYHQSDPDNPLNRQSVDEDGAAYVRFAEGPPVIDAFGNLTVASPVAESQFLHDIDEQASKYWYDTAGGGAITWQQNRSAVQLSVGTASGDSAVRTSNRYHYYTPGQALSAQHSVYLGDTGKVGNTRRWGYFDEANGPFFELQDTTLNVVLRSSVGGVLNETRIPQASWNVDTLDGTGKSGVNLNLLNQQMYWVDFQWHGAGQIRFGVYAPGGNRITCHRIQNANAVAGPYSQTARLPIRFENVNTGVTGAGSELYQISGVVRNFGASPDPWHTHEAVDVEGVSLGATFAPIYSIRPPTLRGGVANRSIYRLDDLVAFAPGNAVVLELIVNGTLTGESFALDPDGLMEVDTTASAITGGQKIATFYVPAGDAGRWSLDRYFNIFENPFVLGADGSTQPVITIAGKYVATSGDVWSSLDYAEI